MEKNLDSFQESVKEELTEAETEVKPKPKRRKKAYQSKKQIEAKRLEEERAADEGIRKESKWILGIVEISRKAVLGIENPISPEAKAEFENGYFLITKKYGSFISEYFPEITFLSGISAVAIDTYVNYQIVKAIQEENKESEE